MQVQDETVLLMLLASVAAFVVTLTKLKTILNAVFYYITYLILFNFSF